MSTIQLDRQAERLAWLARALPTMTGSGIVYCLTVRDTQSVADWLVAKGIEADAYYGSLGDEHRLEAERRLQSNEIKVLVATTALGMGYDKPDLGFVVHFQSPGSPVGYYQQVGRAGRALERSSGVLLRGIEDGRIQDWFIDRAFAPEDVVRDVIDAFDRYDGPVSLTTIQNRLNIRWTTLELVVKQLDVDGALRRTSGRSYERTLQAWTYPADRVDGVTQARRAEQHAMIEYFDTTGCRMRFLANLLDDPADDDCGVCDNCTGGHLDVELPTGLVAEAERFLLSRPLEIIGKKQFIDPALDRRRMIPNGERLEPGRALAMWGDSGWGRLVREGKQQHEHFDDRLVDALADLVGGWSPDPAPTWITSVPSLRRPDLVPSLADRLASRCGVPHVPVLARVDDRPPQKEQQNGAHQQHNVEGAFAVSGPLPHGPVLLVDDVVDSTWTMTEIGRLLGRAGVEYVYPVALASSAGRD